jgi:hypothetical protein
MHQIILPTLKQKKKKAEEKKRGGHFVPTLQLGEKATDQTLYLRGEESAPWQDAPRHRKERRRKRKK